MANEAWRWFDVRGEIARLGLGARLSGRNRRGQRPRCAVFLYRRDSAETILRFDYSRMGEAREHLTDLRARLDEMQVHDFCREVGIAVEWVVGPGSDVRLAPEAAWTSVNRISPTPW